MYTAPARLRASLQAFRLPGTLIISPSKSIAEALIRNGISQTQITVLHHGVETYRRTPIVEGLGKRPLRLIYVGRINPVKGLHVLLRAISNITPSSTWQLDIVGQPVTKKEHRYHRKLLAQGSLLPVSWHGQKTHEEVGQLIAQSDVLVLPSICLEAFGLVVPEALSTGRPVIATRCGGPEEIIDHGINGLLVEPGNSKDLEDAIRNLVINPHKVSEMSDAIQPVQDMESHVTLLLAIYYSAMAMRPTSRRSTEPVPHV
jgi:spore coat protein SA